MSPNTSAQFPRYVLLNIWQPEAKFKQKKKKTPRFISLKIQTQLLEIKLHNTFSLTHMKSEPKL